ncbi:MAG: HAD family hydrolase [Candidatus Bathyarchaeota archaeon]|nr:HAD family hydrolase [Candidatus Bathyarchaeota archaeon]
MALKAVLFDLGLTLIRTASFLEIYRRILARFDVQVSVDNIAEAQKETEKEFDVSTYDENKRQEFWTNYNAALIKKLGITENVVFLASQIDELWWRFSQVEAFPDVEPTLSELKARGLKVGLVSNAFQKDLDHVLGELDLKKWFDSVVCIDSCNCAKPNKEIFLYALDKLQISPNEAVFVGNSIMQDYDGAFAVGIRPFLIDREQKLSSQYNTINSLTDLLTIL